MSNSRNRPLTQRELEEAMDRIIRNEYSSDDNMDVDEAFSDSGDSYQPSNREESSESESSDAGIADNVSQEDTDPNAEPDRGTNDDWVDIDADPVLHTFTEQDRLKINLSENCTPWETFSLIFDGGLIDKIVDWTNNRASLLMADPNMSHASNMKRWTPTTSDEIRRFLGLCIVMGNIQMPSIKSYWSTNVLYEHPLFGKAMARNRFETILRCLCFYNETDDQQHRLHKIDQVLTHILVNIQNVYYPGENLSLDEALVLWRGRLSFRQYIPNKSAKYGVKLYELCTPDGFLLNIIIYTGKGTVTNEDGHASSVVNKLLANYLDKGHTIYMDNFYNSVHLARSLYSRKTHVVGTLRKNRKDNPKVVIGTKLRKGESVFRRSGNVLVQKWKDKREVLTISTKHKASFGEVESKRGNVKVKPLTIIDYNKNMSGVDRCDQMVSYYSTPRKSVRWYLKIFFHLLDVSIWNGCWLYNKVSPKKKSFIEFRDDIALALVNIDKESKAPSKQNSMLQSQHFPKKLEKRRRCRVCTQAKKRSATWYSCEICKDKSGQPIGLCIDDCFKNYHINNF